MTAPAPDPVTVPTDDLLVQTEAASPGGGEVVVVDGELVADADEPTAAADDEPTEDKPEFDPDWAYARVMFRGDDLAFRKPTDQALAGFSLSSSKFVKAEVKNDITGMFIVNHLGPDSYGRVMSRLMDPDDTDYSVEAIGELMKEIVTAAGANAADQAG